jgi:signal transduction histidine kinase
MKRPGFVLFWLLYAFVSVIGPAATRGAAIDTVAVRRRLARELPDSTRVRLLTELSNAQYEEKPVQALLYSEDAVTRARRLPQPAQRQLLLQALLQLASCHANLSNGPQALRLLNEAQTLARQLNDVDGITRANAVKGSIYHERGDSVSAWRHYRRALVLADEPDVSAHTRMKLFGNVGTLLMYRGQLARALHFDSLALGLARRKGDRSSESHYLANIATYHLHAQHLPETRKLLLQALGISRRAHAVRNQASQLELLALYYIQTDQPARTDSVTREALHLARQSGFLERVLDAYSILAAEAEDRKDFVEAYAWNKRYVALNDSLNSRQMMQTLAATQAGFDNEERVRHLRELTQEHQIEVLRNRVLWGAVALLTIGLLVTGYLYQNLRRSRAALAASHAALEAASTELRGVAVFKDKLYAIVAHDLRGPVTAFAGVTGLIDSYIKQNNQAELARLPGIVRQAADSLNRLLDNVLNWAVSQTGELACRPEILPVADLFAECKALYQTTAEAGQHQLTAAAPAGLCLRADHNMTRTILRNLVGNALKFMPPGGHVHLEAIPDPADPQMVLISCTDTGPGMSTNTVTALMSGPALPEPAPAFYTTSLGLGLALCRAFVHRHGGTLVIQSRPGAGTNVTVSLPAAI